MEMGLDELLFWRDRVAGRVEMEREAELEWYHGNGDRWALDSPQGKALMGLPAEYKADFRIAADDGSVNMPDFYDEDGRGYFPRAGDGTGRAIGSVQLDAGRRVGGHMGLEALSTRIATGSFAECEHIGDRNYPGGPIRDGAFDMDSARQWGEEHVADEFRPLNIALTPAIYLGV
jgi:hypothetical protein